MNKLEKALVRMTVVVGMISGGLSTWADTYTDDSDHVWTYTVSTTAATVTGVDPARGVLTIPSELGGKPVVGFGKTFSGKTDVTRVTIPAGVTAIADQAFLNCKNLKGVTINATAMTSIGYQAFMGCSNMEKFVIPNSVTTLGEGVFSGCSALEEVTIGDGITTLPGVTYKNGFSGCYGDDESNTKLSGGYDNGLFYNCTSLKTINWGKGLKTIGNIAFLGCTALEKVEIPDTVTTIGNHAFYWCENLGEVKIGAKVTTVGRMAFRADGNLTKVTFGGSVTEIQQQAFQDCVNLQNFELPATIQYLCYRCFAGCNKALTEVAIPTNGDELETELGQGVFAGCTKLETVTLGDTVKTLPGVTYKNGFSGCYGDDESNTKLSGGYGNGLFYNCTSLKTINWGKGLKTIGNIAFLGCTALETVTLPANVSAIGCHAFYGCSALRTIEVKGSVTSIGRRAFANCANLRYVDFQGPVMAFDAGEELFAFDKEVVIAYAAEGSTGWTGVADVGGLPDSGTWRGARIMYGPADKKLANPYDFYPYTPTGIKVSGKTYGWPGALMLTKARYAHGTTIPVAMTEFRQGDPVYLNYAFDEYWRGSLFENMSVTFALNGAKTAQEDIVRKVTTRDYSYCWGTNVTLNILKDLVPGSYTLSMKLNPAKTLKETDYDNNAATISFKVVAVPQYTVTFNANGGKVTPASVKVREGDAIGTLPTPTRTGYTFAGWYTDKTSGSKVTAAATVAGNATIYAHWSVITYAITYVDGERAGNPSTYTVKDAFALKAPTKSGYAFAGWTLDGKVVSEIAKGTTGNLRIVATWTKVWVLTVKPNSTKYGSASGSGSYASGKLVQLKATAKSGYVFTGWYTDKDCTKKLNPEGYDYRKPTIKITIPAKATTIYAKFNSVATDKSGLKFSDSTKKLAKTAKAYAANAKISLALSFSSKSYPKVTATGLPSGLSIDALTGKITGTVKKPGAYTAKVTVTNAAGNKITQNVKIDVKAPSWATGTFSGYGAVIVKGQMVPVSATFTATAVGKVSGKVIYKGRSAPFTASYASATDTESRFTVSFSADGASFKSVMSIKEKMNGLTYTRAHALKADSFELELQKVVPLAQKGKSLEGMIGKSYTFKYGYENAGLTKSGDKLVVKFADKDVVKLSGIAGGKSFSGLSASVMACGKSKTETSTKYKLNVPVVEPTTKYYRLLTFKVTIETATKKVTKIEKSFTTIE